MSATAKRKRSIFDDSDDDELSEIIKDSESEVSKQKVSDPLKIQAKRKTEVIVENKATAAMLKVSENEFDSDSKGKQGPPATPVKDNSNSTMEVKEKLVLSPAQRAHIEQKRQQALMLKHEKMKRRNPYSKNEEKKDSAKVVRVNNTKMIDTGGGFFIEENEDLSDDDMKAAMTLVTDPAPLFEEDRPYCLECDQPFDNSFLFHNFDHPVCDQCRDNDDKHSLITKTDARNDYLLKDVDFEKREPPLKFVVRKNPHNPRWGDMKLYLKLQVEKRALVVWGSEDALEKALEKKDDQREINKQKKFNKKMKELRMNVRSSLYTRATKSHSHEYGEEVYLPDEDEYSRTCKTCGHSYTYDKL